MEQENSNGLIFIYDEVKRLQIIKQFIKENVTTNKEGKPETGLFFGSELLNLIRYIDKDFYKQLKSGV